MYNLMCINLILGLLFSKCSWPLFICLFPHCYLSDARWSLIFLPLMFLLCSLHALFILLLLKFSFLPLLVLPFLQLAAFIYLLLLFHEELFSLVICCFIITLLPSTRIQLLHYCHQILFTSFFSLIIIHKVQGLSISFGLWCVFYSLWIHSFCCCYFVKNNLH